MMSVDWCLWLWAHACWCVRYTNRCSDLMGLTERLESWQCRANRYFRSQQLEEEQMRGCTCAQSNGNPYVWEEDYTHACEQVPTGARVKIGLCGKETKKKKSEVRRAALVTCKRNEINNNFSLVLSHLMCNSAESDRDAVRCYCTELGKNFLLISCSHDNCAVAWGDPQRAEVRGCSGGVDFLRRSGFD